MLLAVSFCKGNIVSSQTHPSQPENQRSDLTEDAKRLIELKEILLYREREKVQGLEAEIDKLLKEIDQLEADLAQARSEVIPNVTSNLSEITRDAVTEQQEEMALALFPVIGPAVLRAVEDALERLRENIDRQLRRNNPVNNAMNRLRGVDPARIALADAVPFQIKQLFLIQHDSGLVIKFINLDSEEFPDSDLVSGMLTAIRNFMRDSFDPEDESEEGLREVQYREDRIIVESGTEAYVAAVTNGPEPQSFSFYMRTLIAELHNRYHQDLELYAGDEEEISAEITPTLHTFIDSYASETPPALPYNELEQRARRMSSSRMVQLLGTLIGAFILISCCFYLWFTYTLFPAAWAATFGSETPTPALSPTATATAEPSVTPVIFPTQTETIAPTTTPSVTLTPVPPTPTATATETITPTPLPSDTPSPTETVAPTVSNQTLTSGNIWARTEPNFEIEPFYAIPRNSLVTILDNNGDWVKIGWRDNVRGDLEGWIPADWIRADQ